MMLMKFSRDSKPDDQQSRGKVIRVCARATGLCYISSVFLLVLADD